VVQHHIFRGFSVSSLIIPVQIFLSLGIREYGLQAQHGNDFMPLLMWADARTVKYTTPRGIRNQPYFENSEHT
jgi:hypothetical protein